MNIRGEAARPGKPRRRSGDSDKRWMRAISLTAAGTAMVGVVAFAGYQFGTAAARNAPETEWKAVAGPSPTTARKRALLSDALAPQAPNSVADKKSALLVVATDDFIIEPASVMPRTAGTEDSEPTIMSPPLSLLQRNWKMGREERRRVAERKARAAEHNCLARAIYFEARSESELGQQAVAEVILNRVKSKLYPSTICEVVYQGASQRDACQFSFACDGLSDKPRRGPAWRQAQAIATSAIDGATDVNLTSDTMYYHADYVLPKWSGAMTRLMKIGRHIFYSGS